MEDEEAGVSSEMNADIQEEEVYENEIDLEEIERLHDITDVLDENSRGNVARRKVIPTVPLKDMEGEIHR